MKSVIFDSFRAVGDGQRRDGFGSLDRHLDKRNSKLLFALEG